MSKKVNLYFEHDCGYRIGMVHKMLDRGIIDFCLTDVFYHEGDEKMPEDERIVTNDISIGREMKYDEVININELPMPDQELLEKLQPYESMAVKMGSRRTNFQNSLYEEEKKNYLIHVRYWNYILEKYDINLCFFENTPHTQHKYVIYALACVKKIPIIVMLSTSIRGLYVYGNSIGNAGEHIKEYYLAHRLSDDTTLYGNVMDYYEKTKNLIKTKKSEKELELKQKEVKDLYYGRFYGKNGARDLIKANCINVIKRFLKREDKQTYYDIKADLNEFALQRKYVKRFHDEKMVELDVYNNKYTSSPDFSEKYVLFTLQLTPEETTIPKGGVFAEQYTSIQLLAHALSGLGIQLYVKEHFLQPFREKWFYDMISDIPNVKLIHTSVDTMELASNAVALSTQTGTIILEGTLKGKPVLVVGDGYAWKGMPGVFEIHSENDVEDAINMINNGYEIDQHELKKYYYAAQESSYIQTYGTEWEIQSQKKMMEDVDWNKAEKLFALIEEKAKNIREDN